SNRDHFSEYVVLSSSSVAGILMSVVSIAAGMTLIIRSRRHFRSTVIATLTYVGIGMLFRLGALIQGDISQFTIFNEIGWGDVIVGVLMNLSIVSSMLWLGV